MTDATAFNLLSSFLTNLIRTSEIFKSLDLLICITLIRNSILLYVLAIFKSVFKKIFKKMNFFTFFDKKIRFQAYK